MVNITSTKKTNEGSLEITYLVGEETDWFQRLFNGLQNKDEILAKQRLVLFV